MLVTASRAWEDGYTIFRVLNEILNEQGTPLTVIHGDAKRGGDHITRMWCEVHPAGMIDQKRCPVTPEHWRRLGRAAGQVRNQWMVDNYGPHLCVAFLRPCGQEGCPRKGLHWSHGAEGCLEYAKAKGVPVRTLEAVMV